MSNIRLAIIIAVAVIGSSVATGFVVHNQNKVETNEQSKNTNISSPTVRYVPVNTNTPILNANVSGFTNTNVAVSNKSVPAQPTVPKPKTSPVPINTNTTVDPAIKIELCKNEANIAEQKEKVNLTNATNEVLCNKGWCMTADQFMAKYSDPNNPQYYYSDPATRQKEVDIDLANQTAGKAIEFDKAMAGLQPILDSTYNDTYGACLKK